MKRTVFYARVSTIYDNQIHSLNEQREYFTHYINNHDDYLFSGEYYDEGISGTSLNKRQGFNRMINDALNHKFDLILVKDISRFSRNTLDTIEQVRLLKSHGIDVVFVNDHIDTSSSDGELSLTLLATMAQEESRKISNRVKWSMSNDMKDGRMFIERIYGYDVVDGKLVVNEEEAEAVRMMYRLYLDGLGLHAISKRLRELNIKTARNKEVWQLNTLAYILSNEKYIGDLATHKVSVDNYLTHKSNKVDKDKQYYFKNHHEPIIDRDTFDKVQKERARRSKKYDKKEFSFLTGRLECGCCNGKMRKESKRDSRLYYLCTNHVLFNTCSNHHTLSVNVLKNMLKVIIDDVFCEKELVHSKVIKAIKKSESYRSIHKEKVYYEKRLKNLNIKKDDILNKMLENSIDINEYKRLVDILERQYLDIKDRLNSLNKMDVKESYLKTIESLSETVISKLDDDMFLETVITKFIDKIVFRSRDSFDIYVNTNKLKLGCFDKSLYRYITVLEYDFSYMQSKYTKRFDYSKTCIGLYVMEV